MHKIAYFDVAHDPQKPFVVHCGKVGVNTFGSSVITALVRGKVELQANGHLQLLAPGNVGKYNNDTD